MRIVERLSRLKNTNISLVWREIRILRMSKIHGNFSGTIGMQTIRNCNMLYKRCWYVWALKNSKDTADIWRSQRFHWCLKHPWSSRVSNLSTEFEVIGGFKSTYSGTTEVEQVLRVSWDPESYVNIDNTRLPGKSRFSLVT